ncbi:MAG: hypothetical protein WBG37_07330, partial [Desulfobacterales bacterium]
PIASFAADDDKMILTFRILNRNGIDDPPELVDGVGHGLKGFLYEGFPGLIGIRLDPLDFNQPCRPDRAGFRPISLLI